MRAALVAALALAACAKTAAPPAPLSAQHEDLPAIARSTAAPAIRWQDAHFVVTQLPAVARDGSLAVVAVDDGDSGRGFPNLRIEVRDRSDRVIDKRQILESNDFEQLAPDGAPNAELEHRISDANKLLADLHARRDLQPTTPLQLEDPQENERLPITASGDDGLQVAWTEPRVIVRRGAKTLASVDGTSWLPKAGKRCPTCEPCANPAFLGAVSKAPEVELVVVELAFNGTDTCWEPGHQFHVIAW